MALSVGLHDQCLCIVNFGGDWWVDRIVSWVWSLDNGFQANPSCLACVAEGRSHHRNAGSGSKARTHHFGTLMKRNVLWRDCVTIDLTLQIAVGEKVTEMCKFEIVSHCKRRRMRAMITLACLCFTRHCAVDASLFFYLQEKKMNLAVGQLMGQGLYQYTFSSTAEIDWTRRSLVGWVRLLFIYLFF